MDGWGFAIAFEEFEGSAQQVFLVGKPSGLKPLSPAPDDPVARTEQEAQGEESGGDEDHGGTRGEVFGSIAAQRAEDS